MKAMSYRRPPRMVRVCREEPGRGLTEVARLPASSLKGALQQYWDDLLKEGHTAPLFVGNILTCEHAGEIVRFVAHETAYALEVRT